MSKTPFGLRHKPMMTAASWPALFTDYKILTEWDKVKKNTRDDYNLGFGWYYFGGAYTMQPHKSGEDKQVWTNVYVRPESEFREACRPHMCEGNIGRYELIVWKSGEHVLWVKDRLMIARRLVTMELNDVPDDLAPFYTNLAETRFKTQKETHAEANDQGSD